MNCNFSFDLTPDDSVYRKKRAAAAAAIVIPVWCDEFAIARDMISTK